MEEITSKISPELLARAKDEDEDACDRLVEILYPLVAATVFGKIRRSADHDDVIQEVFMKMFVKFDQYKGPRPFEHWLSRLAVTTCYDWLRKHRARRILSYSDLSESEAEIVERTLSGSLASDSAPRRELLDGLLDKLIDRLNPREQIVIRLRDLEERSVTEIEEITGWSASKIKTLTMRARRKLARHLQQLEGPHAP
jgi:RNA polymerase sigma-70 factor (ECF subfamily)